MEAANPVDRFTTKYGSANWAEQMIQQYREYGICVIQDVFTSQECNKSIEETIRSIEQLGSGVRRDDVSTWNRQNLPSQVRVGMYQGSKQVSIPPCSLECAVNFVQFTNCMVGQN